MTSWQTDTVLEGDASHVLWHYQCSNRCVFRLRRRSWCSSTAASTSVCWSLRSWNDLDDHGTWLIGRVCVSTSNNECSKWSLTTRRNDILSDDQLHHSWQLSALSIDWSSNVETRSNPRKLHSAIDPAPLSARLAAGILVVQEKINAVQGHSRSFI